MNRLSGNCEAIGSLSWAGYRPLISDGNAHPVMPVTAVALRYQVEVPASRAKLG